MKISRKEAFKELLIFSLPIIFGHIGIMLVGTGDMIIAGRYSRECLAAIGLAISIANPIMMLALGLQFALSPLLAKKRGEGEEITGYFWTVMLYSLVIGVGACGLILIASNLVPYLHYTPELNHLIIEYLEITSFSMIGICLFQGVKEVFQSLEKTIAPNLIALSSAAVNLFFAYAFVFGKFGMPQMKEVGLAWSCLMVRIFMGGGLFLLSMTFWKNSKTIRWGFIREAWSLGLPITVAIFFEVMAFCSVTLFVGKFSAEQTAANNLALNIGSLAFMIPMSIASAVGVKVGHAFGEKNLHRIRTFSFVSLIISIGCTGFMASMVYLFPEVLLSLFTEDTAVLGWGKTLLFWVACFQLFDGSQVTLAGILRGLSITRASSLAIFFGYWIIGIPLGYYLGFYAGMEAQGFWIGLALSLALVAMMLAFITHRKIKALEGQGFYA